MNRISKLLVICYAVVLLSGCEEPKPLSLEEIQEIENLVNQSGTITNNQAERLSKVQYLSTSQACQTLIYKYKYKYKKQ